MLQIPSTITKVPPKRRVHFSADETDSQSAPHEELTAEMIQDMWYTSAQISANKKEAKAIIRQRYIQLATQGKVSEEVSEMALGLERYEPKRDEFRRHAIYYTLQAQNKSKDPDFIRLIVRKCTAYSRAVATHQGLMDYESAYNTSSLDTQGKKQQRDVDVECDEPRSKKQRIAVFA